MNRKQVRNFLKRLYGPTGSILLHVLVIALLFHFVKVQESDAKKEAPPIEFELVDLPEVKLPDPLPKKFEPAKNDPRNKQEIPTVQPPAPKPEVPVTLKNANDDAPTLPTNPESLLDAWVPDITDRGPSTPKWENTGATTVTETSVTRALDWLQKQQLSDGSWEKNKIAMTGLALLTYLAHGETPGSIRYGKTVEKGIAFLLSQQRADGFFGKDPGAGNAAVYAHAIASYAISEAYGMTRAFMLKEPMDKSITLVVKGQQAGGGWYYGYQKGDKRDTSVSGWQIQALKAAKLSGADVRGLDLALKRAAQDIKSNYNPNNFRFGYTSAGSGSMAMTGVGVLSLQLLGQGRSAEVRGGLRTLKSVKFDWEKSGLKSPLYAWYYITQATFHQKGGQFDKWNKMMKATLTAAQASDGHWDFPLNAEGKSEHGATEGPVCSTTLATLMLEVYYRFLPTFQENAAQVIEEVAEVQEDIIIEIR